MRQSLPSSASSPTQRSWLQARFPWLYAFWKFSRPHTIIGTTLSVIGVYLITLAEGAAVAPTWAWLPTVLACLCGNVYIVGLNQLEDVAIDRINKPHLPLASGEFSRSQGNAIVATTGLLAIVLAALQGPYLLGMVAISLAIGTAYSLPPIRLKRFPLWASLCIFSVRGMVVNLGLFLHFSQGASIPPSVWALTALILVFTFAIAIFKDIPDAEGDRRYNITTFTLRLGQRTVFNLARWVITSCYVGLIVAALVGLPGVNLWLLIGTHGVLLAGFWWRSWQVNLNHKAAIAQFYQFIWKLFFLEYLIFPLTCLLR